MSGLLQGNHRDLCAARGELSLLRRGGPTRGHRLRRRREKGAGRGGDQQRRELGPAQGHRLRGLRGLRHQRRGGRREHGEVVVDLRGQPNGGDEFSTEHVLALLTLEPDVTEVKFIDNRTRS